MLTYANFFSIYRQYLAYLHVLYSKCFICRPLDLRTMSVNGGFEPVILTSSLTCTVVLPLFRNVASLLRLVCHSTENTISQIPTKISTTESSIC
jgi:hypothetical protein